MCRLPSILLLVALLLSSCVSMKPHFTATNFLRDSKACERQTHQIAGETEFQVCMARLGWPDPRNQASRIDIEDSNRNPDRNLLDDAIDGLQFGIQWDLRP